MFINYHFNSTTILVTRHTHPTPHSLLPTSYYLLPFSLLQYLK
jgi:hypothetical protein